ncbi:hypothetical protein NP233_g3248 [Leucocoprinus birnbaumii]|uniref:Uncharacterized protein n=1 Tax=Leucocoprinus birnbaumii TaxID=56174 RepID=A0AAD5YY39_9AGAR|nr:hypothetical protein NP233_g3248 [Leucocoprinus birnbaumii]
MTRTPPTIAKFLARALKERTIVSKTETPFVTFSAPYSMHGIVYGMHWVGYGAIVRVSTANEGMVCG